MAAPHMESRKHPSHILEKTLKTFLYRKLRFWQAFLKARQLSHHSDQTRNLLLKDKGKSCV